MTDNNQSCYSINSFISVFSEMALKMVLFWVSVILSVIGINAIGEFTVVHSPSSLRFSGSSKIPESSLKDVYSASLGLSVSENAQWDGLNIVDPFNTPEAIVEVYIDGVASIKNSILKAKNYPLVVDEYEPETYEAMRHRIMQRFNNRKNKFIDINISSLDDLASYTSLFGDLSVIKPTKAVYSHLRDNTEEDAQFMKDLRVIKAITAKVTDDSVVCSSCWMIALRKTRDMQSSTSDGRQRQLCISCRCALHRTRYILYTDTQSVRDINIIQLNQVKTGAITPDNVLDFYYFRVQSLHALSDYHGPNSLQVKEATRLLVEALQDLSNALEQVYTGSVLFTIVTTDVAHTRRTIRATPQLEKSAPVKVKVRKLRPLQDRPEEPFQGTDIETTTDTTDTTIDTTTNSQGDNKPKKPKQPKKNKVLPDAYSGDYAAIFNIILWFSVVFVFALLAIVYALADMDPGRDSIIYRMTNIRMKKDN